MERREVADLLQIEGVEEQVAAERGEGAHGDDARTREGSASEEADFQERFGATELIGDQGEKDTSEKANSERISVELQPRTGPR